MIETVNDQFSQRLNQELDRVGIPSLARPKRLANLTNKSIPGARKWLVNNSIPRGNDLEKICKEYDLDNTYILMGIRNKEDSELAENVNVLLQSTVFVRVYQVAKKHGIDIHSPHTVSVENLEKTYKVLMKIASKHPNEDLDEDLILTLIS